MREVDGMNLGDMEAGGVGAGVSARGLQVATDVVESIGDEVCLEQTTGQAGPNIISFIKGAFQVSVVLSSVVGYLLVFLCYFLCRRIYSYLSK